MVTEARALPSLSSGDDRFDTILGGGIPLQSVVVITGEPGSGKTVLTMQMLFRAAREGHRCLYFTTISEPAIKVIRYMQLFEFFDEALVEQRVIFSDLASCVGQGPERTLLQITNTVEKYEPAILVIDSFRAIVDLLPDARVARAFVYELSTQMASRGITTLLVGEYTPGEFAQRAEFAVADGIIRLDVHKRDLAAVRELEVLKLRLVHRHQVLAGADVDRLRDLLQLLQGLAVIIDHPLGELLDLRVLPAFGDELRELDLELVVAQRMLDELLVEVHHALLALAGRDGAAVRVLRLSSAACPRARLILRHGEGHAEHQYE